MSSGALPSALKCTEAATNTFCRYGAPMVFPFGSLRHLMVTCILKTKRHRTYIVQYFRLFTTGDHTASSLCANLISLCIYNWRTSWLVHGLIELSTQLVVTVNLLYKSVEKIVGTVNFARLYNPRELVCKV
jgi:hypothetical protein